MVLGITTFRAATAVALTFFSSQPIYNEYNRFASTYDGLNGGTVASNFGIQSLREEAGHFATGNVLDVAVGTGLQNSFYDWTKIMSYTGKLCNHAYSYVCSLSSNIPITQESI